MLEKYSCPYLSVDHLKMGLICSGNTALTPGDDEALTGYLWPIVREIIRTAIENGQDLIVEGCYIPPGWRADFDSRYLPLIRLICLVMTEGYIDSHYDEIIGHESEIESRKTEGDCSPDGLKESNRWFMEHFGHAGEKTVIIEKDYEQTLAKLIDGDLYETGENG